jgi:hypothetical protein
VEFYITLQILWRRNIALQRMCCIFTIRRKNNLIFEDLCVVWSYQYWFVALGSFYFIDGFISVCKQRDANCSSFIRYWLFLFHSTFV